MQKYICAYNKSGISAVTAQSEMEPVCCCPHLVQLFVALSLP